MSVDLDDLSKPIDEIDVSGDEDVANNVVPDDLFEGYDGYFEIKPPNKRIKVMSSVVLNLPLYSATATKDIDLGPEGTNSIHNGQPLSFEYIYRNFQTKDFAQLLVNNNILSKAIRYALLYNYFGIPVANIAIGSGQDPDFTAFSYTGFSKRNNIQRRVFGSDPDLAVEWAEGAWDPKPGSGPDDKQELDNNDLQSFLEGNSFFTEYVKGFYQLGFVGEIEPITSPEWGNDYQTENNEDINYKHIGHLFADNGINSFRAFHGHYFGAFTNKSSKYSLAYVEPLGVDAEYIGLSAFVTPPQTNTLPVATPLGPKLDSLYFNPSWNVPTNNVPKTYARAWFPSNITKLMSHAAGSLGDNNSLAGDGPPTKVMYIENTVTKPYYNSAWEQVTNSIYDDLNTGNNLSLFDSVSLTAGSVFNGTNAATAETPESWYHSPGTLIKNGIGADSPLFNLTNKEIFAKMNIATMYKLLPMEAKEGAAQAFFYKKDPANTLNKILPKICQYVFKVAPDRMYEQNNIEYGLTMPGSDKSSPLNSSDVITKGKTNYKAKEHLRKFRIGHSKTKRKANATNPNFYEDLPAPSSQQGPELGYTHILGTGEGSGYAFLNKNEIYTSPNDTVVEKRAFRNKLTVNFKTQFHRDYVRQNEKSLAVKGYYAGTGGSFGNLADEKKKVISGIFGAAPIPYLPQSFPVGGDGIQGAESTAYSGELDKSYFFSTKLLSYMYLMKPAGYDNSLPSQGIDSGGIAAHAAVKIDIAAIAQSAADYVGGEAVFGSNVILPSIFGLYYNSPSQIGTFLQGVKLGTLPGGGYQYLDFDQREKIKNAGTSGTTVTDEFLVYNNNTSYDVAELLIEDQSKFGLPVWNYEENTPINLEDIQWGSLKDSNKKFQELKDSGAISEYPGIENLINFGIPKWVKSLRIYPCPDKQIIPTNPNSFGPKFDETNKVPAIFPYTYKDVDYYSASNLIGIPEAGDVASAALKIIAEPVMTTTEGEEGLNNPFTTLFYRNVEIRYVVEMDIDERELILDMVGAEVATLGGTKQEYIDAGFDIEELIEKTKGNVQNPDLIEELETGGYDFGNTGDSFIDYGLLPGIFPQSDDGKLCPTDPPKEIIDRADKIFLENQAGVEDEWKCTSYICLDEFNQVTTKLKKMPGTASDNVGYIENYAIVKVTKEWVNGKGEFNKILVVDPESSLFGETGFIPPTFLKPIFPNTKNIDTLKTNLFFDQVFEDKGLSLGKSTKLEMSEMAKALIPKWYQLERPYYHREDIEYWINVELPDFSCIVDEQDLESKKQLAKRVAIKQLFDFYNVKYTEEDVEDLVSTYLAVKVSEFYIDPRPNAPIKFLVKIGGIYLEGFNKLEKDLIQLKESSSRILSLDTRYYQKHLEHAIYSLNKIYLDIFSSKFAVPGLDLQAEAKRLNYVSVALNSLISTNGYTFTKDEHNIINIGFDENYGLTFISFVENVSSPTNEKEHLLSIGFNHFKNQEPFNYPNTMSLFIHHREMKNPTLDWRIVVEDWMINPTYKVVPKKKSDPFDVPVNSCGLEYFQLPSLTDFLNNIAANLDAELDLHPRYDLGSFQFNLLPFFPPCPRPAPGYGDSYWQFLSQLEGQTAVLTDGDFAENAINLLSGIKEYTGDWVTSGAALRDIKNKVGDLDDLWTYVLNYISPELLFSKICKCFLDLVELEDITLPNFEMKLEGPSGGLNLNPATIAKNPNNIIQKDGEWKFSNSFLDKDGNIKNMKSLTQKVQAEDLFCSFCFALPSIFFRLPTTNLLDALIDLIKKLLEFALAQILLQLVASLLDALLTCPEITCPENQGGIKDFGGASILGLASNDLEGFGDSLGLTNFSECGLNIDGQQITNDMVSDMLRECSAVLTSAEVLSLYDGDPNKETLKVVLNIIKKYPSIAINIGTMPQITALFQCVGKKIDPKILDGLAQSIVETTENKEICDTLIENSKKSIVSKCGFLPDSEELANKYLNPDFKRYIDIAKIIRENDNLSSQLPPLFSDGMGTQGIMSSVESDTTNWALEQVLDSISVVPESQIYMESKRFTNSKADVLVKGDKTMEFYISQPPLAGYPASAFALGYPFNPGLNFQNNIAKLFAVENNQVVEYEAVQLIKDIGSKTIVDSENYIIKLQVGPNDYVEYRIDTPVDTNQDGTPDYTNNYTFNVKNSSLNGLNASIKSSGQISDDILGYLQQFDLDYNSPEQAQIFSNMILSSFPVFEQSDTLKDSIASDVYMSIINSCLTGFANATSESKLLEKYEIWNKSAIPNAYPIPVGPGLEIIFLVPYFYRYQTEKVGLINTTPDKQSNKTFVNFEFSKQLAKAEYDFSRFYDPNAEFPGNPHYALFEAVVSQLFQLFAGESFLKGFYTIPFLPKELFFNEIMAEVVYAYFDKWLNSSASESLYYNWALLITRMMYEKTEFTPYENSKKPLWPGEPVPKDEALKTEPFGGTLYDPHYGTEFEINSSKDCALYYIRKNLERPISFIKDRFAETTLDGVQMDGEIDPYQPILLNTFKEVNDNIDNVFQFQPNNTNASFVEGLDILERTKNGTFAVQYYFRFEDFPVGSENYNKFLSNRTPVIQVYDSVGDIDLELFNEWWVSEEDAVQGWFEELVEGAENIPIPENIPQNAEEEPNVVVYDSLLDLKSVLSRKNVYDLWRIMNASDNQKKSNFNISGEDKVNKTFSSMFKSIKFGVRLCYVIGDTTRVDPNTLEKIVDQGVTVSEQINKTKESIQTSLSEDLNQLGVLHKFSQIEKSLLITDKYPALGVAGNIEDLTPEFIDNNFTYILPIISKEQDVSNAEVFNQTISKFDEINTGKEIDDFLNHPETVSLRNELFLKLFTEVEGRTLFKYGIGMQKIAMMTFLYNAIILSTDDQIDGAFDNSKKAILENFESIFAMVGNQTYKKEPNSIKEKGGVSGISTNFELD